MPKRSTKSTWLTRPQVAALAGTTEDEMATLDNNTLHPVREGDRSWRYDPAEVAALLRHGAGAIADAGELAARAFEMFRAGKDDVDVVIATRRIAGDVRVLRAEYGQMSGTLALPPATAATLRRLFGDRAVNEPQTLGDVIERELAARYAAGYRDGQEEAEDFGEVIDQVTGERHRVKGPAST